MPSRNTNVSFIYRYSFTINQQMMTVFAHINTNHQYTSYIKPSHYHFFKISCMKWNINVRLYVSNGFRTKFGIFENFPLIGGFFPWLHSSCTRYESFTFIRLCSLLKRTNFTIRNITSHKTFRPKFLSSFLHWYHFVFLVCILSKPETFLIYFEG